MGPFQYFVTCDLGANQLLPDDGRDAPAVRRAKRALCCGDNGVRKCPERSSVERRSDGQWRTFRYRRDRLIEPVQMAPFPAVGAIMKARNLSRKGVDSRGMASGSHEFTIEANYDVPMRRSGSTQTKICNLFWTPYYGLVAAAFRRGSDTPLRVARKSPNFFKDLHGHQQRRRVRMARDGAVSPPCDADLAARAAG